MSNYINTRMAFFKDRLESRHNYIDPNTGERPFVYNEEERRKAAMNIAQLERSMAAQETFDRERQQREAQDRAAMDQRNREHAQERLAVVQRAQQLRIEREAEKLASSGAPLETLSAAYARVTAGPSDGEG